VVVVCIGVSSGCRGPAVPSLLTPLMAGTRPNVAPRFRGAWRPGSGWLVGVSRSSSAWVRTGGGGGQAVPVGRIACGSAAEGRSAVCGRRAGRARPWRSGRVSASGPLRRSSAAGARFGSACGGLPPGSCAGSEGVPAGAGSVCLVAVAAVGVSVVRVCIGSLLRLSRPAGSEPTHPVLCTKSRRVTDELPGTLLFGHTADRPDKTGRIGLGTLGTTLRVTPAQRSATIPCTRMKNAGETEKFDAGRERSRQRRACRAGNFPLWRPESQRRLCLCGDQGKRAIRERDIGVRHRRAAMF